MKHRSVRLPVPSSRFVAQLTGAALLAGALGLSTVPASAVDNAGATRSFDFRTALEEIGPDGMLWYQHVMSLANPYFEGRANGTAGTERARDYMEWWFRSMGLEPAFPTADSDGELVSYRQPFEFRTGRSMRVTIEEARVSLDGEALTDGEQFTVLGNSGNGEVTAPITFVGYGIKSGPDGYSSFDENTNLTGRIAMLLRYEPLDEEGASQWSDDRFSRQAGIAIKIASVLDYNPAGIILVNPPNCRDGRTGLEPISRSRGFGRDAGVPVVQVTPEAAEMILDKIGADHTLYQLRRMADRGEITTKDFDDDHTVSMTTSVRWRESAQGIPAQNVGAVLRGRGDLRDEWLVIGGHYDHNGYGWFGTTPDQGPLYPGADDNASGTAGVLVLARALTDYYENASDEDLRSVMFLAFDAEERGLFGSAHFADEPSIEPDRISAMLNLDMMGRLRANTLSMLGTETAEGFADLLQPHFDRSGLTIEASPSGSGRSDDANFARIGVPAVHVFTGMHPEYTTPEDHAWTVNPQGAARILGMLKDIAIDIATRDAKLEYSEPSERRQGEDRGYAPVRLGIRPGMQQLDRGIVVQSVSADTSASEGGMQDGDVMLSWDGEALDELGDLMDRLGEHTPGDKVVIRVLRGEEEIDLDITLKASDG